MGDPSENCLPWQHIRPHTDEPPFQYFARVAIDWAVTKRRAKSIANMEMLTRHLSEGAFELGQRAGREETAASLTAANDTLRKENAELKAINRICVSKREAEEGRTKAGVGMRMKASLLAEGPDGEPTSLSEAIMSLPLPRPMWT